jgi:hypothetical protein
LSPLRKVSEGPVGGAKSLSPRGPVGGESRRRGGDRSLSRLLKSRLLSLACSRSRKGDLGSGASLADRSSTSAALLGWIGGGDERRDVAPDSLPDASLDANVGFAGDGDRRLHVSAAGGSTRSRLGDGERRRNSRVSRTGEKRRGGLAGSVYSLKMRSPEACTYSLGSVAPHTDSGAQASVLRGS